MSRLRVLRVIARMNVGGPALQVSGLHAGLDRELFDCRLVTGTVEPGEADFISLRGREVDVVVLPQLGRSIRAGSDARALRALVRQLREFRPHIVHTHTAKAGVLGRVAAVVTGDSRVVHTFHGHLLHGYFGPAATTMVRQVERVLARRTDALLSVGAAVRDDLLAAGIGRADQYRIMPPGVVVPPPPSREDARKALGVPADVPVVGFTGRLTAVKRPDRLLAVIRQLAQRRPDVVLLLAGEGPLLEGLRASGRDLSRNIRFLGWRSDVETIYAASDVVVLTSDNEGMPVSLIEAAMCDRPAVTTDVGSAAEVVRHDVTGLVVPSEVGAIADALDELLSDERRRREMGREAGAWARNAFSMERLVRDTTALYLELAGGRLD